MMINCVLRFIVLLAAAGAWASCLFAGESPRVIGVQPNLESPTAGIQEAIDSLGPQGGVVKLVPGDYPLRQSIRVVSNLTIEGAGEQTVLRKGKQVGSKLAARAGDQDRSLRVELAAGLQVGDEIGVFDQKTVGWEHQHAIIKQINGNELVINRRVGREFDPATGAAVINYFPAISGLKAANVVIKGLTIHGRGEDNPGPSLIAARAERTPPELGFTFAAINLIEANDSHVENCHVKEWPADGISLQRGSGNRVTNCVVERCRGEGLHPGGGLSDSEFSDCIARSNLANGLFFCARVQRVAVKRNKFIGNQGNGIGDLGHDGDTNNVVESNRCEANGKNGIQVWDGTGNTLRNNECLNNSQSSPGRFSGIWLAGTTESIVSANRCFDNQATRTQKHGIEELANCNQNTITDNEAGPSTAASLMLLGKGGRHSGNRE